MTHRRMFYQLVATWLILTFSHMNVHAQIRFNHLPSQDPSKVGFTAAYLQDFTREINDSIPCLGSFLIWRNDGLVYEKYFHGADSTDNFSIKSVTKSVVSALAGIAKSKGLLPSLQTPVFSYFPEFDPQKTVSSVWFARDKKFNADMRNRLTLYDLLTMQHGWDWNDFSGPVNIFINAADPIRFTWDIPFVDTPGTRFLYSSAAASLFGAALEKITHSSLKNFAEKNLLAPTGMNCRRWDTDPQGRSVGASEMFLTARDMMRFGILYLQHGRNGSQQIIPADWVDDSFGEQATLNYWDILPGANGYGYYWWRRKTNRHQAYIASGAGGQIVTVIPDLQMVVVATCLFSKPNRGREELKRLHQYVDQLTRAIP